MKDIENENTRINYVLANSALKYAQSNNISIACQGQVIGMGCGQQNRVGCVMLAGNKALNWARRQTAVAREYWSCLDGKRQEKINHLYDYVTLAKPDIPDFDMVMASDGFFPFTDNRYTGDVCLLQTPVQRAHF